MNRTDRDELRKLAEEANPEKGWYSELDITVGFRCGECVGKYTSALHPARVISLLDTIDELERDYFTAVQGLQKIDREAYRDRNQISTVYGVLAMDVLVALGETHCGV